MPTYDTSSKKSFNYYGVFSLWSSILLFASFFVLYTSGCVEIASPEIQITLAIAFVSGIVIFMFSFCNVAIRLFHHKFFFYLIIVCLLIISFVLLYISYITLGQKCDLALYYERNYSQLKNISTKSFDLVEQTFRTLHNRRNDHYTVSAILDLIAGVFFVASAYAFRNRF